MCVGRRAQGVPRAQAGEGEGGVCRKGGVRGAALQARRRAVAQIGGGVEEMKGQQTEGQKPGVRDLH